MANIKILEKINKINNYANWYGRHHQQSVFVIARFVINNQQFIIENSLKQISKKVCFSQDAITDFLKEMDLKNIYELKFLLKYYDLEFKKTI